MKTFFAVLALAAVAFAEPEADPALLYSGLTGYAGLSTIAPYAATYAPYTTYAGAYSPFYSGVYGYSGYNAFPYTFGAYSRLIKREAEAEADPALLYSGLTGYTGLSTIAPYAATYASVAPYTTYAGAYSPFYSGVYGYSAYNAFPYTFGAYSRLIKREAEAEADPALLYSGLTGYTGLSTIAPYAASTYAAYPYTTYAGAYAAPFLGGYSAYTPYWNNAAFYGKYLW